MPTEAERAELEAMAARLEASGEYRVVRRLGPLDRHLEPLPDGTGVGLFLDLETTGLDPARHEVIEVAMVRFAHSAAGELLGVGDTFQAFCEPSEPIPPEITALTGIDDAMVAGRVLDQEALRSFAAPAMLVLSHNAGFDRRFAERLCDLFTFKPWACSLSEAPWREEGYEGRALVHLAAQAGFFDERHRALHDCLAAVELLRRPLPRSGRSGLSAVLEQARRASWRIWAENAPYNLKDALKARCYRWNTEETVGPRAWWTEVAEPLLQAERLPAGGDLWR